MNGDSVMAVSHKQLWKLLVNKEMSKSDLRKKAEIAPQKSIEPFLL